MKIERFEELPIWKDARIISSEVYKKTRSFKDFSLRDQMRRAAVSIVSNIAEGFERWSNKEFIQFLYIAKGSVGELRAQLYVAYDAEIFK
ncbi:MAG: four helix bundle protein [Patescibacteria group bacterium]